MRGLRIAAGKRIAEERRAEGLYESVEDLGRRCALREDELAALASLGALGSLGLSRRKALWQVARVSRPAGPLYEDEADEAESPLPEMTPVEETVADFHGASLTAGIHPVAHLRRDLKARGIVRAADVERFSPGTRIRTAGSVVVRQRPGTAKGVMFMTLEDESGMIQAMVAPELFRENRGLVGGSPGLVVEGIVERRDGSVSIKAERFWALRGARAGESHDFR